MTPSKYFDAVSIITAVVLIPLVVVSGHAYYARARRGFAALGGTQ